MTKAYSYIRFSTPEQLKGNSQDRQKMLAERYCKAKGLILDSTLKDLGKSAFKGDHVRKGALGVFLEKIEAGEILPGSVLIAESADRLSREAPYNALKQFMSIIEHGISLVTLDDSEYSEENATVFSKETLNEDLTTLIQYVGEIVRAHKESKRKSGLGKRAWEKKRHKTVNGEIKLTGRVPFWINYDKAEKKFTKNDEAVKAIKLIFQKKLDGKGEKKITHELNIAPSDVVWKPLPRKFKIDQTRGTRGGWEQTTVTKLLRNRQLLGEYEPCKMVDGRRKPNGVMIPNYFPKVIDADLFNRVQNLLDERSKVKGNTGGKTGKANNVFAHIVKCGFCGNPMHFVDKGRASSKNSKTLHCSHSREKNSECTAKPIHYDEFSDLIFENFEELDLSQLMPEEKETKAEIKKLSGEIDANKGVISELLKQEENGALRILRTPFTEASGALERELNKIVIARKELEIKNEGLIKDREILMNQKTSLEKDFEVAKEIRQLLDQTTDENELINFRLKLRSVLISMIDWIKIYPRQSDPQRLEKLIVKRNELMKSNKPYSLNTKMRISALNESIKLIEEGKEDDPEPESGLILMHDSKTIDKVRIKLNGGNIRSIYLKRYTQNPIQ
jgi:DNA invertase Pin-like site-specific DNA recombinase